MSLVSLDEASVERIVAGVVAQLGASRRPQRLLAREEAATYLGLTIDAFKKLIYEKKEIPAVYRGRKPMFDIRDLDGWIEKNKW